MGRRSESIRCVVSTWVFGALLLVAPPAAGMAQENPDAAYVLGPDSQRQADVPQGSVTTHQWTSAVFPGTTREYSVYIPKQYDGTQPACLMVFQDGHAYASEMGDFRVPVVLDNLIHRGELPVMIGLFINPGHHGDAQPENRWRASNRSFEYDTLSDQYARFVMEELLPHVVQEQELKISADPQDHAICGISSGGICAFTAAWEHPEWFSKVLSHVGSFTNIRGGHHYEAMIRKTRRKPIRVLLQDGENDLNNEHGNWWLANLQMDSSLRFKGYDCRFVGGVGGHSGKHGGVILPESLKWLWRDHVVGTATETTDAGVVDPADVYQEKSLTFSGGEYADEVFRYRLLAPPEIADGQKYPLVIFLHGAGERGTDNLAQLKYFPTQMAQPLWRSRFPCYVLAPQSRSDRRWVEVDWSSPDDPVMPEQPGEQLQVVMQLIEKTLQDEAVDPDRVYLTGLSMGGFGTWDLAIRRPEWFAAVGPICGGADPSQLPALKNLPVWLTHGDADTVVP
ncbi:MAG: hypothetical protein KDA85_18310, partial [Planctomycetaceae bacterium]|nr:hypothetical protein [Planctomycetaceae bacterium]